MRVCASPSMVKDGSSWGAHAGTTRHSSLPHGFTGAPAVTVEDATKYGTISAPAIAFASSTSRRTRVPVGAACDRRRARGCAASIGFGADEVASIADRELPRGSGPGVALLLHRRRRTRRSTACRIRWPPPSFTASARARSTPQAATRPSIAVLAVMMVVEGRRVLAPLPAERWARSLRCATDARSCPRRASARRSGNPLTDARSPQSSTRWRPALGTRARGTHRVARVRARRRRARMRRPARRDLQPIH
jgi:hypothetical protein